MCYHSKQTQNAVTVAHRFKADIVSPQMEVFVTSSHWNGYDYPKTPVITNQDLSQIQLFHWGLIPNWSKEESIRQYTLNAKIETLDEKPSFKHHQDHRCLVLANGFFEWQWLDAKGKKKQKYEIGIANDAPFAFAGIWSEWLDPSTGELKKTYAIVTNEAQGVMRKIHNSKLRMPIILRPDQEQAWLAGDHKDHFLESEIDWVTHTENLQGSLF